MPLAMRSPHHAYPILKDKAALVDSITLNNNISFAEFTVIGKALGSKIYFL